MDKPASALTYATYLKVNELLALQAPRSSPVEHDEMLFIVIHQVYELWFKQVLHELGGLRAALTRDDVPQALHGFKRVLTIFKTLVAQVDVIETMTPVSFASFRARLQSASGFQSRQFRMVEFELGKREARALENYAGDTESQEALLAIANQPSLYDAFLAWLATRGFAIPEDVRKRERFAPTIESPVVRSVLVDIYRHHPTEAAICERLVDLDEGLQEWRYRHVKMVERTIGFKMGTGGSAGAEYLRSTLFRPLFPDLWAIRSEL
jgi:tryptophan 2,3-dioxygenase